ncbi:Ankyrin-like protein, partial [Daphnia magna]
EHNEASDSQTETNYLVIESDIETESETQRDGLFGDYGFYPPTFEFNPNDTQKATLSKCSNCAMKTHPTLSAARADAIQKRTQAITRLRDQEVFLEMIDAPREEIRRCIIQKMWSRCMGLPPEGRISKPEI